MKIYITSVFVDDRDFRSGGMQTARPFVGNGMWVTSLSDPDGYQIHFERITDVPKDTEYSDDED